MIAPWVEPYIGIPFVSCGRTRDGCDCYGLVRLIQAEQFGVNLPVLSDDYTDAWNVKQTKDLFTNLVPALTRRIAGPEIGCVVVLYARGWAAHLGTYVGHNYMVTTESKPGSSYLQRLDFLDTRRRIEGFYRVKNNR